MQTGSPAERVWETATSNLIGYLAAQGLAGIEVIRAAEAPERSPTSGKYRQVIAGPGQAGTTS